MANEVELGQWGPVLTLPNVAVHAHVLPDGRVLMWGRRDDPSGGLDPHECTPFIWDPQHPTQSPDSTDAATIDTPQPALADRTTKVNLFCGGHAFLPDGRLLAIGGHLADSDGVNQAALFAVNHGNDHGSWEATSLMLHGRWYPTATTLPDGSIVTLAGSWIEAPGQPPRHNEHPQVWSDGSWRTLTPFPLGSMDLYPRAHVISDGRVFISGPLESTWFLNTTGNGSWQQAGANHRSGQRDYAPAVMYDEDKILYIGGGGGANGIPPTNEAKIVDFKKASLQWEATNPMHFGRRQHNATLLPDGTVLVTGGTRGSGFNNLDDGMPVHQAELWNPQTRAWTLLAAESVDRCYHSTAVLLPDATVLSAGGGEFKDGEDPNHPRHNHRDGQIFRPPYLFRGPRPEITSAPEHPIGYGETFELTSPQSTDIQQVTWIRLSSVTHAFNQSQRINRLAFLADNQRLRITAPATPNVCPPGHYMLFILDSKGVPSVARIVQIQRSRVSRLASSAASRLRRAGQRIAAVRRRSQPPLKHHDDVAPAHAAQSTRIVVGLTSTCPYGLGACWGGAHEALGRLEGIAEVGPVADTTDSTAEVLLSPPGLPPLDRWVEQFQEIVNGRYEWRGVEITMHGLIETRNGDLFLADDDNRPAVALRPLETEHKIQWDTTSRAPKALEPSESRAFADLTDVVSERTDVHQATVTGPLQQTADGYLLRVRQFHTHAVTGA